MSETEDLWKGSFGDEYHKRNRVRWTERVPFWRMILDMTCARSVYELGCGPGWNLSAIRRAYPDVQVAGWDINDDARWQADVAGIDLYEKAVTAELVLTCGMLIHVPPEQLEATMRHVIAASVDWVLAIEYHADKEACVPYREQERALWKRPYGEMYRRLGLSLVDTGYLGRRTGFDECTYWLMRKT